MEKPHTQLLVNSFDRQSGTSDDFSIALDRAITDIKKVELIAASIPSTWYTIDSVNQKLVFTRGSTFTINITPGLYSATTLATQIATQMNAADANTYTCSLATNTLLTTIAGAAAFVINWSSSTINGILGYGSADSSSLTSQVSPSCWDLSKPLFVYLRLEGLPSRTVSSSNKDFDQFAIQVTANGGNLIIHDGSQHPQEVTIGYPGATLKQFKVKLLRHPALPLLLNGAEWSFLLHIEHY